MSLWEYYGRSGPLINLVITSEATDNKMWILEEGIKRGSSVIIKAMLDSNVKDSLATGKYLAIVSNTSTGS